uniref:F-box domain-containing protein n=1 Tax=Steinernema glaseri TaxID=37863 RepID=A0A1I7Y3V0_9BILA
MFRTTDTPLLPRTIIYEILKNARRDFKEHLESAMQVSEEWKSLLESALDAKYSMYLKVTERERCNYFYYCDISDKQTGYFAQLDELQCERLGELRIVSAGYWFGVKGDYAVDFKEDSPTMKVQFRKLEVNSYRGDLDILPEIVPTDFEEISVHHSAIGKCFPLPATLKKLDLNAFCFCEPDSLEKFLSFVQKMTWEEIVCHYSCDIKSLERIVVEAWRDADDPQLKHFQSDKLLEKDCHTFFEKIQHMGRRVDERTLHIDHKKLKKTLCITIKPELDSYKRLHMRCL